MCVQRLVKEDQRTGNNTEDEVNYPAYWSTLLECMSPHSGLSGAAIVDSEPDLITACSPATTTASAPVCLGPNSDEEENGDEQEPHAFTSSRAERQESSTPVAKRASPFALIQTKTPKKTKKMTEFSKLTSSVTLLVDHIAAQQTNQEQQPSTRLSEEVGEMRLRLESLEEKLDRIADTVTQSITLAIQKALEKSS